MNCISNKSIGITVKISKFFFKKHKKKQYSGFNIILYPKSDDYPQGC